MRPPGRSPVPRSLSRRTTHRTSTLPHRRARLILARLVCLLFAASLPHAQISTGGITGRITDEKGEPLPGVLVTVRSVSTGFERAVPANAEGDYSVLALPPDDYVVQVTIQGYGASPRSITVRVGQSVFLPFRLEPGGGLKEEIVVTRETPLLNRSKVEISTVVSEQDIHDYPLLNRDFNDLAVLAPGVKQSPGGQFDPTKKTELYSPFTTGGTAGRNVNISIDGVDNNDNVVGFFVQGFPLDAVREFEVIEDQYRAEYGRSLGGVVNVVTKSGTNDFGGSVFGLIRSEDTRSRTFGETLAGSDKNDSDRQQYGFSVGGPIVKDRLFYFVAYEKQNESNPLVLSNLLTSLSGTEPAGFPFPIASPGTTVPQDFERDLASVRFDYNASKNHTFWARWSMDDNEFQNDQGGPLSDPSNQGDSTNDIWSVAAGWQWTPRANMVNELRIHRNDFENKITTSSPDPLTTLSFDAFQLGRNANTPQSTFQQKFQIRDDITWIVGRNTFKAGAEYFRTKLNFTLDLTSNSVNFAFNPGVEPAGSMASGDANANGVDDGIEVISRVFVNRPLLVPPTEYSQYAGYFQDDWRVSDRWTLNLGLRVDVDAGVFDEADEGVNRGFYECFAHPHDAHACGLDPNVPNPINPPRKTVSFHNTYPDETQVNVSPRVGFVYRVGGEDKDVVRASWGLFYDKLLDNLAVFMRSNNSPSYSPALPPLAGCDITQDPNCAMAQVLAGSAPIAGYDPLPADFTLANWENPASGLRSWVKGLRRVQGPATFDDFVAMPSPDWKTPYTSAFSLGWGHQFRPGLVLDTNLVYRRGFRQPFSPGFAGRATGRDAPFPVVVDPNTGTAQYPGFVGIISSEGKSQYVALQTSLRGRSAKFDFACNLTLSEATGTQDLGGTLTTTGFELFPTANIRWTGGDIDSEWGRVSGNQTLYAFLYGNYRLPMGFRTSAQVIYGTKTSFHGVGVADLNGDGFLDDYSGTRGGGLGDDYFLINWRLSKTFNTGKGTSAEIYLDVFNVLNHVNHGIYVVTQPYTTVAGVPRTNPDYAKPTGATLSPPRTAQLGMRFSF